MTNRLTQDAENPYNQKYIDHFGDNDEERDLNDSLLTDSQVQNLYTENSRGRRSSIDKRSI